MIFCIQASNPRTTGTYDPNDETLDECVETAFLLNTEMAIINWLGVFIPLHYKYTISTILPDIITMLQTLLENEQGEFEVTWPSSDFNSRWVMSWGSDHLSINAKWEAVIGNTEEILNSLGPIEIGTSEFICEWKALFKNVLNGLRFCGYEETVVNEISRLREVYSRIEKYGVLYQ